jgi:hypothetical protein
MIWRGGWGRFGLKNLQSVLWISKLNGRRNTLQNFTKNYSLISIPILFNPSITFPLANNEKLLENFDPKG